MAGQGPSRRELLQALTLAAAASAAPGFCRWSYGLEESQAVSNTGRNLVKPIYLPVFFTVPQYQTIEVLTDLILPSTPEADPKQQPGATEAGVAEFVDFMVYSDPTLQPRFRNGLVWLDQAARPAKRFLDMGTADQNTLLDRLAYKSKHREDEKAGQEFFQLVRQYTVMGFYTTKIGLESLDYPGLKFYGSSPGCTHAGNPEHAGL